MIIKRNICVLLILLFFNFYWSISASFNYQPSKNEGANNVIEEKFDFIEPPSPIVTEPFSLTKKDFVLEIPEKFKDVFYIEIQDVDIITVSSKLRLKGYNKLAGNVFVNGKKVSCDRNGYFTYDYKLTKYGINNILISFSTNSFQYLTVLKKVKYLFTPKFISKNVKDKKLFTYFYNLELIYDIQSRKLTDFITRLDIAYFVYTLNKQPMIFNSNSLITDIPSDSWFYSPVQYSLEEGYLGLFPDSKFYPEKNVSMLELLISLARYQKLNLNSSENFIQYKDFSKTHWASKFVQACVNAGLIVPEDYLYPNSYVTIHQFISIVNRLDSVNYLISDLEKVDNEFEHKEILIAFHEDLKKDLRKEKIDAKNQIEFKLDSLDNFEIVYNQSVSVNGTMIPAQPFYFNSKKIEPNIKGDFNLDLNLLEGRNDFNVNIRQKSTQLTIFYLSNFKDLSNHWFQEDASKLRFLNFIEATPTFNPKEVITRLDFVKYAVPFFENEFIVTENKIEIVDLDDTFESQDFVYFLLQNDIFSIFDNNKFYPNKPMKRVEALAATMKYIDFKYGKSENDKSKLPYWDVSKNHWGQDYIQRAYQSKFISKSANFYPEKIITKDQLIALFSKLPNVESKVSAYFEN
jgi:hypothetical protein